eukprot:746991-Hanusia_phi.AAC.8
MGQASPAHQCFREDPEDLKGKVRRSKSDQTMMIGSGLGGGWVSEHKEKDSGTSQERTGLKGARRQKHGRKKEANRRISQTRVSADARRRKRSQRQGQGITLISWRPFNALLALISARPAGPGVSLKALRALRALVALNSAGTLAAHWAQEALDALEALADNSAMRGRRVRGLAPYLRRGLEVRRVLEGREGQPGR